MFGCKLVDTHMLADDSFRGSRRKRRIALHWDVVEESIYDFVGIRSAFMEPTVDNSVKRAASMLS